MNLLSIENITKSFSEKILLNNINLGINDGDKIGVIGVNGTGKSTLLKIVAGILQYDEGYRIIGRDVKIEYLPQNPNFNIEATVIEQVFKANSQGMKLVREYEKAIGKPNTSPEEIIKLSNKMDAMNAWNIESEAKIILTKLGITDYNEKIKNLSGGQKKRVALASSLITPCDLLILDEPTNHLDNDSIDWLEQYLKKRKGAILMITHDRYFLDRVVNEILEIYRGNLYFYKGNYSFYLEEKLRRDELQEANQKKKQNLYSRELAWIRRGAKARSTKQKARIERFEEIKDNLEDTKQQNFEISVSSSRLGKKIIELNNINKSYGNKTIIKDFSYIFQRGDRIGIVGLNGIGKSTLMNIICGKIKQDSGNVDYGDTVKIGLFSQENSYMNNDLRVIEYIKEGAEYVSTSTGYKISASQMLERFLFEKSMQWTPIEKLSGGEKRRLQLLRVLIEAPNVLLLDEPTNDLDIQTLTILEDYIENFPGVIIAVSHDRYFLDKISQKIFSFTGNGEIQQFVGGYTDYRNSVKDNFFDANITQNKITKEISKKRYIDEKEKPKIYKFSYKEQREYEEIDEIIEKIEENINIKNVEIQEASTDYELLQRLLKEKETLESKLEEKLERWTYLSELAEKIMEQKNKN